MAGLRGLSGSPRAATRARRDWQKLFADFSAIMGDGMELTGAGLIAIDLASGSGLKFVGGDLSVDDTVYGPYTGATANLALGTFTLDCGTVTIAANSDVLLSGTGHVTSGSEGFIVGTLTVTDGSIIDSDGTISFSSTNLATTGTISTPELYNTGGDLKIMPDAQGDVHLFGDTDVGDNENGKKLIVWRKAAEGDSRLEFFINSGESGTFRYIGNAGEKFILQNNVGDFGIQESAAGNVKLFTFAAAGDNPSLTQAGYITNGTNEVEISWTVRDTDDYFHLDRENTNILGLKINMPTIIGDGTNYVSVASDGDLTFVGSAGIVYGHMYTNDVIAIALTDQNTWYELNGATAWTSGVVHRCTFSDPAITVLEPGIYEVVWSLSTDFSATPGSKQEIEYGIMVGGAIQAEGQAHRTLSNSTDTGNACGVAILDLADNAVISLAARNVTSSGKTLNIPHGNMTVKQVGGT